MAYALSPNRRRRARRGTFEGVRWGIDKQTAVPPNSPADPLPIALYGLKIPLSVGLVKSYQDSDLESVFDVRGGISGAEKMFFP